MQERDLCRHLVLSWDAWLYSVPSGGLGLSVIDTCDVLVVRVRVVSVVVMTMLCLVRLGAVRSANSRH